MAIACIGWGSLINTPRELPVASDWHHDGPDLPVEFARQSQDDRLTLVLVEGVPVAQTLWCALDVAGLDEAVKALQAREGTKTSEAIGRWPLARGEDYFLADHIGRWVETKGLSGAVWTALPPGFKKSRGQLPTLEEALAHLGNLDAGALKAAARYIRTAPVQIRTRYRPALEAELDRLG